MHGANKSRENSISKRWMPILLLLWVTQALPVLAQDQTISQMVHTSWTGRDGAPAGIRALAQTPDGILWIASFKGLYSFDGLSFISFQPNQGSPGICAEPTSQAWRRSADAERQFQRSARGLARR